jgi:hypothetical protein
MLSHHPLKNYKETLGCSPSTPPKKNLAGSTPGIGKLTVTIFSYWRVRICSWLSCLYKITAVILLTLYQFIYTTRVRRITVKYINIIYILHHTPNYKLWSIQKLIKSYVFIPPGEIECPNLGIMFTYNLVPRAFIWGRGETRESPGLGRSILHSDWLTPHCLKITELDSWQY